MNQFYRGSVISGSDRPTTCHKFLETFPDTVLWIPPIWSKRTLPLVDPRARGHNVASEVQPTAVSSVMHPGSGIAIEYVPECVISRAPLISIDSEAIYLTASPDDSLKVALSLAPPQIRTMLKPQISGFPL